MVFIMILAVVQGMAELLPVSSSAHVIVTAKFFGHDATTPEMTLLLAMLHTGTMFAVIVYFWKAWQRTFFSSKMAFQANAIRAIVASFFTAVVYLAVKYTIEKVLMKGSDKDEIETLFGRLDLIALALAAAGVLILISGLKRRRGPQRELMTIGDSVWIGLVQGLCIPFRGFSRSGATISVGLLRGGTRARVEEFSFALAVILTPAAIGQELLRYKRHLAPGESMHPGAMLPGLFGMACSFVAGLAALALLSRVLEKGKWWMFGVYCLVAAAGVMAMHVAGY